MWDDLLYRCIPKGPKHYIYASLVSGPLRFEPFQHILIDPQRDCGFRRQGSKPAPHYPTNDMPNLELGVLLSGGG